MPCFLLLILSCSAIQEAFRTHYLALNTLDEPPLCKPRKTRSHLDAKLGTYIPSSSTYLSLTDLA